MRQMLVHSRAGLQLTILYHPQVARVGERAGLGSIRPGVAFELSRLTPLFQAPVFESPVFEVPVFEVAGRHAEEALNDPYLSRQPIQLICERDGLTIDAPSGANSLHLNGAAVTGPVTLSRAELEAGAVLLLARRVAVLMQLGSVEPDTVVPDHWVGSSPALARLARDIGAVAPTCAAVMLRGETGTGKELAARAIHEQSERASGPLVSVNMAAIPAELAVAELFGSRKGAFTGAQNDRPGYFQQANGGTLFLDEIGACPAALQPLLLRALESGEIQPAGGQLQTVDVRVISATDADVETGEFSSALLHRLSGVSLDVPPLRERRDDIARLFFHYLQQFEGERSLVWQGAAMEPVAHARWAALLVELVLYSWPGNVRQLQNVCRQLALTRQPDGSLQVPQKILATLREASTDSTDSMDSQADNHRLAANLSEDEVVAAMVQANYEPATAARLLSVSRTALYKRVQAIPALRLANDLPAAEVREVYDRCDACAQSAAAIHKVSRTALLRRWRALELPARPG